MQEQVTIMMTYYRTDDQVIHEEEKLSDGVWVQMINPTHDECEEIAEKLMVDIDDVKQHSMWRKVPVSNCRMDIRSYLWIFQRLRYVMTRELIHYSSGYHPDTGYHCHNLHGGYTGIAELCAEPGERIQHKEEASFCVSDPLPDGSNLSGKSPDHR